MFSESNSRRICHSTSTSTLLVLSASFNYDNYAASDATLVHAFVASQVDYCGSLLIGAPGKTTDKIATCPQLGSTNSLEHAQVRQGSGLGSTPKNFGTPYLFVVQLKLMTSYLVSNLGSWSTVAKNNF